MDPSNELQRLIVKHIKRKNHPTSILSRQTLKDRETVSKEAKMTEFINHIVANITLTEIERASKADSSKRLNKLSKQTIGGTNNHLNN